MKWPGSWRSLSKQHQKGVLLILLAILVYIIPCPLAITRTRSLDHWLFYVSSNVKDIKTNDYVMFHRSDYILAPIETQYKSEMSITKKVGCTAGQTLSVRDHDYFCEETYLGTARDLSSTGTKVRRFIFNGTIPAGKLFVVGATKDSYDSRYMGFLDEKEIRATAIPLL